MVSPEPEITIQERNEADEFLVLACDGIWDVMNNDDLCDFIRHQLRIHSNLETVCSSIIDTCLHKVRYIPVDFKPKELAQKYANFRFTNWVGGKKDIRKGESLIINSTLRPISLY